MEESKDLSGSRIPIAQDILEDSSDEESPVIKEVLERRGISSLMENAELREVIEGALSGELPLDKPLEVNQPQKLSQRALQTVLLAVGGYYTMQEVAAISGMNYVYVTKLLKHPYARRILTIANASAVDDFSNFSRRVQRKVPKMLKIVQDIAEDQTISESVRLRAAFGWIDYAKPPVKTQESPGVVNNNNVFMVPSDRAGLLSEAIREASAPKQISPIQEADFETVEEGSYEHPELEPEEEDADNASRVA